METHTLIERLVAYNRDKPGFALQLQPGQRVHHLFGLEQFRDVQHRCYLFVRDVELATGPHSRPVFTVAVQRLEMPDNLIEDVPQVIRYNHASHADALELVFHYPILKCLNDAIRAPVTRTKLDLELAETGPVTQPPLPKRMIQL